MVDLKRVNEPKVTLLQPDVSSGKPQYHYGLRITLESPELEKLDILINDYNIGDVIEATVNMEVKELQKTEEYECVGLQITNINIE